MKRRRLTCVVSGGQATNIVMEELSIKVDTHSLDDIKLAAQVQHMIDTFQGAADKHGAELEIVQARSYNAFKIDDNDSMALEVAGAFEANGIKAQPKPTGGSSDASVFKARGIKSLNLATGISKVYTTEDFIAIQNMADISDFLHTYLTR